MASASNLRRVMVLDIGEGELESESGRPIGLARSFFVVFSSGYRVLGSLSCRKCSNSHTLFGEASAYAVMRGGFPFALFLKSLFTGLFDLAAWICDWRS